MYRLGGYSITGDSGQFAMSPPSIYLLLHLVAFCHAMGGKGRVVYLSFMLSKENLDFPQGCWLLEELARVVQLEMLLGARTLPWSCGPLVVMESSASYLICLRQCPATPLTPFWQAVVVVTGSQLLAMKEPATNLIKGNGSSTEGLFRPGLVTPVLSSTQTLQMEISFLLEVVSIATLQRLQK